MEESKIQILRSKEYLSLPARFTLIAAANPCPCGHYGNPEKECTCTNSQIKMYRRKLTGPLIDRMDIFVQVPQLKYEKLVGESEGETSAELREKIEKARKTQEERLGREKTNSQMEISQIKKYCSLQSSSENLLRKYVDSGKLSARGYHRVLKVARTIADLENSESISPEHLSEALSYRKEEV